VTHCPPKRVCANTSRCRAQVQRPEPVQTIQPASQATAVGQCGLDARQGVESVPTLCNGPVFKCSHRLGVPRLIDFTTSKRASIAYRNATYAKLRPSYANISDSCETSSLWAMLIRTITLPMPRTWIGSWSAQGKSLCISSLGLLESDTQQNLVNCRRAYAGLAYLRAVVGTS